MTHDLRYSFSGGSVSSFSPSRRFEVYHYGIFYISVKGALLRPISLNEKMWFVEVTSYFDVSAMSLQRNLD